MQTKAITAADVTVGQVVEVPGHRYAGLIASVDKVQFANVKGQACRILTLAVYGGVEPTGQTFPYKVTVPATYAIVAR